jgi:hypothetical protein
MDPSPLLHPVGPEPARIYWLRRLVLLGVVLVFVLAVAYACTDDDGESKQAEDKPIPGVTATSPAAAPTVHRCGSKRLTVEAATDAETYPVGSSPRLTAVVRNTSGEACRLAIQPSARSWSITSGPDEVWSTDDCVNDADLVLKRLKAGKQVTYAVTWDGHRSEPQCAEPGAAAQPGTYRVDVTVDGARSQPVVFHLTG